MQSEAAEMGTIGVTLTDVLETMSVFSANIHYSLLRTTVYCEMLEK